MEGPPPHRLTPLPDLVFFQPLSIPRTGGRAAEGTRLESGPRNAQTATSCHTIQDRPHDLSHYPALDVTIRQPQSTALRPWVVGSSLAWIPAASCATTPRCSGTHAALRCRAQSLRVPKSSPLWTLTDYHRRLFRWFPAIWRGPAIVGDHRSTPPIPRIRRAPHQIRADRRVRAHYLHLGRHLQSRSIGRLTK